VQREREAERKPRKWPKGKILMAICLLLLIFGSYAAWQYMNTPPSSEETTPPPQQTPPQTSPTTENIYIMANGTVYPSTAPISNKKNSYYTFKSNINMSIIVERDNIVIDGAGYNLNGGGILGSKGIDLTRRTNVTVKNIKISGFDYGVYLNATYNSVISQNELTDNYCGVWLAYSSNNKIALNVITNITLSQGYGIWLKNSSKNNVFENKITLQLYGIYLKSSNETTISANSIVNNTNGVYFFYSFNNTFSENNVTNNVKGVNFLLSSNNTVNRNYVANNNFGISFDTSSNNIIYHNNFVNNSVQAYDYVSTNFWDNGKEGNYWSDYKQIYPDAEEIEGIWNKPYAIDGDDQDNYPLVNPKA
jgi:parallel beta-helix repeat protein